MAQTQFQKTEKAIKALGGKVVTKANLHRPADGEYSGKVVVVLAPSEKKLNGDQLALLEMAGCQGFSQDNKLGQILIFKNKTGL